MPQFHTTHEFLVFGVVDIRANDNGAPHASIVVSLSLEPHSEFEMIVFLHLDYLLEIDNLDITAIAHHCYLSD